MDGFDEIAARLMSDPQLRAAWRAAVDEITAAVMRDSRLQARVYGHRGPGTVLAYVGGQMYRSRPGRGLPAAAERKLAERHHQVTADPRALYAHSRWHRIAQVTSAARRAEAAADPHAPGWWLRGKAFEKAVNDILGPLPGGMEALAAYSRRCRALSSAGDWRAATAHLTAERGTGAVGRFLTMWFDPR